MAPAPRNDLTIYDRHGHGWWDPRDRQFASLRSVNRFRLDWLLGNLGRTVAGLTVADLGCGGGLMSVPIAQRGARVFGFDLSRPSLRSAQQVADGSALFAVGDVDRCPLAPASCDLVLLADVIEHVADWRHTLTRAAELMRPGGQLYVNTLNRTRRARWLAVHLAEGIGLVPRGTHDPELFVKPVELQAAAQALGLRCTRIEGEAPALAATLRSRAICLKKSRSLAVAYAALFAKDSV